MADQQPEHGQAQAQDWQSDDWRTLAHLIHLKRCTPFLGAGVSSPTLPTGRELASRLAVHYEYPCADAENLPRVAQWAVTKRGEIEVKATVKEWLTERGEPDFKDDNEPHHLLVDLELPVYITTNYDEFLVRAFGQFSRQAHQVICPWHQARKRNRNLRYGRSYSPTPASPLIFHLHGALSQEVSMVLTEDDYLDFLIYVHNLLPPTVEKAFEESALLFLGYGLADTNFKVLFRKLNSYSGGHRRHFAVQIDPQKTGLPLLQAQQELRYLTTQYDAQGIRVFWGSCRDFARELRRHLWPPPVPFSAPASTQPPSPLPGTSGPTPGATSGPASTPPPART
jgi:hypothetical protein